MVTFWVILSNICVYLYSEGRFRQLHFYPGLILLLIFYIYTAKFYWIYAEWRKSESIRVCIRICNGFSFYYTNSKFCCQNNVQLINAPERQNQIYLFCVLIHLCKRQLLLKDSFLPCKASASSSKYLLSVSFWAANTHSRMCGPHYQLSLIEDCHCQGVIEEWFQGRGELSQWYSYSLLIQLQYD